MKKQGMTLLEVMFAVTIFTLVMAVLYSLSMGFARASEMQEIKITTNTEARRALQTLAPRLRQASRQTVNRGALPGDVLTFMMADDVNGNGSAVNVNGDIELVGPVTIQRDANDVNGDGETMTQLVMIFGNEVRVLANDLMPGQAAAGAGNDIPDGVGFWVAPRGNGYEVTVRPQGITQRGQNLSTIMTEFIVPRNR